MDSSFDWNSKTKVEFLRKMPSRARLAESLGFSPEKCLVVYDKRLVKSDVVKKWLKEFEYTYPVAAGEGLKDMMDFPGHVKKIFRMVSPFSAQSFCVVALGGGTIGDFAGFLANVLKRGVPLIHIPSTLLAAMDSAHGGKTALNVREFKNQVGTFYPAVAVLLAKSNFEGLPRLQLQSAGGELAKMALISGGDLYRRFCEEFTLDLDSIWNLLPAVIEAKYKVVDLDPLESTGERQILNFGHSLGHALESYFGLAHGVAVGQGLIFALEWSAHQGYMRGSEPKELVELLIEKVNLARPVDFVKANRLMSRSKLNKIVMEDKKLKDARRLSFVFLEKVGIPYRKAVTIESMLTETQRQGWTAL